MKTLVAILLAVNLALGFYLYHHIALEDQDMLRQNSDLFTDKIEAQNKIFSLIFEVDTLKKYYAKLDSASGKTDTIYIRLKQRVPMLSADSTCSLLATIYTEIDSTFAGYFYGDIKP